MKCPHCGLIVTDQVPECHGCGFTLEVLDRKLRVVPERIGFANDFADLLTEAEKASLEAYVAELCQRLQGELVLVTVRSTAPVKPSEYVFWLFNRWEVGGVAHAGLMVLLTQRERRIECEVGYGWEPIVTDLESGKILDEKILPLLKDGKFFAALAESMKQLAHIIAQGIPPSQAAIETDPSRGGDAP